MMDLCHKVRFRCSIATAVMSVLLAGCASAPNPGLGPDTVADYVILPASGARGGSDLLREFAPLWDPPREAVTEGLAQLRSFLSKAERDPLEDPIYTVHLPELLKRLPRTLCQAVGVTYEGRKGILLNCFPTRGLDWYPWREVFLVARDGGPSYWSVVYLFEEKKFVHLRIDLGL